MEYNRQLFLAPDPVTVTNNIVPVHNPVANFWSLIAEGPAVLGVHLDAIADRKLVDMIRGTGYEDVHEQTFHLPLGTWPENKNLKTVGLYWRRAVLDGIHATTIGPLTHSLGWSPEDVEVLLVEVRKAYSDNAARMYMPFHIVYAQKLPLGM